MRRNLQEHQDSPLTPKVNACENRLHSAALTIRRSHPAQCAVLKIIGSKAIVSSITLPALARTKPSSIHRKHCSCSELSIKRNGLYAGALTDTKPPLEKSVRLRTTQALAISDPKIPTLHLDQSVRMSTRKNQGPLKEKPPPHQALAHNRAHLRLHLHPEPLHLHHGVKAERASTVPPLRNQVIPVSRSHK